jgi:hypothetical protein
LLARNGKTADARTELAAAAAIPDGDPALRARAYRTLARLDQAGIRPAPATSYFPRSGSPPKPPTISS